MSSNTLNLNAELYAYFQANSLREPEVLRELREQTAKMSTAGMQISPEQGQFMRLMMVLIGAKKTLELGVFTGYSTLSVALGLPSDGKIIACDKNSAWTKIAAKYWEKAGVSDKIDLRLGNALDTLDVLFKNGEANSFDFAFIDADKLNYVEYYERCLTLLRPNGLMMVDNTLWSGAVADVFNTDANTEIIRTFNKKVHADQRVDMSMLPLGDGLTLLRKI
jgi:predicted O-methyltransferase YrrM